VRKASKETWRAFCTSIKELPRAARLHRVLSRDPKVRLGSLVAPSGRRTRSEEETLDLILGAHFPGSGAAGEGVPGTFGPTTWLDWQVANRVVTYRRVGWAIDSFDPYRSSGMDGIVTVPPGFEARSGLFHCRGSLNPVTCCDVLVQ
jgi:hypothetical protein